MWGRGAAHHPTLDSPRLDAELVVLLVAHVECCGGCQAKQVGAHMMKGKPRDTMCRGCSIDARATIQVEL